MRVAIVKTSSMGDVIHALPVVSDILRASPEARIDWIVEEAFAALPPLHPGVGEVHRVALRRWRRAPLSTATWRDIGQARASIRRLPYDQVIDLQGLIKSAWIASWARGARAGFSWRCAREPLASLTYRHRYPVDMSAHAIERLRALAARALGYRVEGLPVFGLRTASLPTHLIETRPFAVLLHATSRDEKRWPLEQWRALRDALHQRGLVTLLPWGGETEQGQAAQIAEGQPATRVLPRMSLSECASLISRAALVVGVDTGLTHLACALEVPSIALFGATDAHRFGPYWTRRAVALGAPGSWPGVGQVLAAIDTVRA